jgi:hypothetical protein
MRCTPREMHAHEVYGREMYAYEVHTCEMHVYEVHTHEMHACEVHAYETLAHEMHTREMCTREIYAHRSMAFLGGYSGAGVAKGCPRTAVFTLGSDDDVDSLHQTQ